jgi:hypothetical protein
MIAIGMRTVRHSVMMLALTLAGGLACGDRLVELDEELDALETQPVCMILTGTRGYWDNGDSHLISDPERGTAGGVCTCMTEAQLESRELFDELNDAMLVECERLSALLGFDWDECAENHASGHWLGGTYLASPGNFADFLVTDDLDCE